MPANDGTAAIGGALLSQVSKKFRFPTCGIDVTEIAGGPVQPAHRDASVPFIVLLAPSPH